MSKLEDLGGPDAAGSHAEDLLRILRRIPEEADRRIDCGSGWYPILVQLDADLARLDPDYVLHQVKEKFGELRFYATFAVSVTAQCHELVRAAETLAGQTCEGCGQPGQRSKAKHVGRTLCVACRTELLADGSLFIPSAEADNPRELVAQVRGLIGAKLVAYLAGVESTRLPQAWAVGAQPVPEGLTDKLRVVYRVAKILEPDTASTVQAWLQGMSPELGDVSPIRVLRERDAAIAGPAVIAAARAFRST